MKLVVMPDRFFRAYLTAGGQPDEDGTDHVVDEVKDGSDEEAQVLVQPYQPLVRVQRGEAGLQGQHEKDDGADRGH